MHIAYDHKPKVCLALVHNNNDDRNARIIPWLQGLQASTSEIAYAIKANGYQPGAGIYTLWRSFLRDLYYWKLQRDWTRHRLCTPDFLPLALWRFARSALRQGIRKTGVYSGEWRRKNYLYTFLADKHVNLWNTFLNSDDDFLICFEDDAVFETDSVARVNALMATLSALPIDMPCYIDLAGGCDMRALQVDRLQTGHEAAFRSFSKPVTNTTCVYLMNRAAVELFYAVIIQKPWYRLIGIDWMINRLIMETMGRTRHFMCRHADPTVFKHGSVTGDYAVSV